MVYLGCADTELNRAIGRKVLIAAVHRARNPGCKFDNITVLESPEGRFKSTAIRVLAGDENFSDQRVLGASDKEVQEQLGGIWMMRMPISLVCVVPKWNTLRHLRAGRFRARPAYGRVREDRKRRSIEWGTTNTNEYLLSQTGNRRFWPLETGTIDLVSLRRDRLQLLGEAATYEAAGESVVLDEALWPDALAAQEERRAKDPWEDILAELPATIPIFGKGEDGKPMVDEELPIIHYEQGEERVRSKDLLEHVLEIPPARQSRVDAMRLSEVMKAIGWKRNPNGKVRIAQRQESGYWREAPTDL